MSYRGNWNDGPCFVYALVDPRSSTIYYVGISINPEARLAGHRSDPASAAWSRTREIIKNGFKPALKVLSEHPTRDEALRREFELISSTPNLVNACRILQRAFS